MWLAFLIAMILGVVILSWGLIGWLKSRREAHHGVRNHNLQMTEFEFFVPLSPEAIRFRLENSGASQALSYVFDGDSGQIQFFTIDRPQIPPCTYQMVIRRREDGTLLKVIQLEKLQGGSYPRLQNEFWQEKLGAKPIVYGTEF